jgi:hypothetical protein
MPATKQERLRIHADRMQRFCFAVLGASLVISVSGFTHFPATMTAASSTATIVSSKKPLAGPKNPDNLRISYTGSPDLVSALESGAVRPTALTAADFDLDGAPDLVMGYSTSDGGVIALLRGNPDAFAPKDQNLYQAAMRGQVPPTFLSMATVFGVPESPDFLVTGDFNRDGYEDLLVGKKGGELYLLYGDGCGNLLPPELVSLPGEVAALAATSAGHVAVGTDGPEGPRLVVLAPSRSGLISAATYTLPASATSIAWGALGGGTGTDLAVSSGTSVVVIYSALSPQARRVIVDFRFQVEALILGDFIWDRNGMTEMAVLGGNGLVHIMRHGRLDTRPFTAADLPAHQAMLQRPAAGRWSVTKIPVFAVSSSSGIAARSMLQSPRLIVSPTHDLMILDAAQSQINIFDTSRKASSAQVTVKFSNAPVAAYATPQKLDGGRDLVVLTSGQVAPLIIPSGKAAKVNVNTTADTDRQNACTDKTIMPKDLHGSISLRTGVCAADNYGAIGSVTIYVPAGAYQLTSLDTGELQIGLVPGSNISIIGSGTAANTIIKQTDSMARVFNFDPNMVGNVTGAVSNVTVTGGNATSLGGGGMLAGFIGDSYTVANAVFANNSSSGIGASGGGIDLRGGSLSMTNCTITNNTAHANVGGGIAITNGTGSRGNVALINTVVTGNTATENGSAPGQGGGVFIDIDASNSATISGSTVMLNTATGSPGHGGGIFNQAGPLSVVNSRVVNNQAGDASGIYTLGFDATATDNWWGCNDGPGASGCDTVDGVGGMVAVNPWLVLSISASPTQIKPHATSTLSADLTHDSSGTGGFSVPTGTPVSFSGVLGSVEPSQTILTNGIAASTYTAGPDPGAGRGTATVDNQSVSAIIDIVQAPAIINTNHTTFTVGKAGMFLITTGGFPAPTITENGALPTGVTFKDNGNGTGTLAGVPAAGTGGSNKITFTAQNGVPPTAQQNFTLTIREAPAFTSTDNANFQMGKAGSFTVTTTGFPTSSITQTGKLPKGVGFADNHNDTGTLSGTSTIAGMFNVEFSATNNAGNAKQNFTLTVQKANTGIALSSSANPSALNQSVVFSASVSSNGTGTPTGKVEILDGGTTLGSPGLDGSGVAKLSIASLSPGPHSITAAYLGDDNYAPSTSPIVRQIVTGAAQFSLTGNPSALTVPAGTPANFTITATGQNGFNSVVSLACTSSTLPVRATCQFSPPSITPGASPATSALTITTTAPALAQATPSFRGHQPSSLYAIWLMMPALLVSTVGLGGSGRRKILGYSLMFGLIAGCLLQSACGGGMTVGGNGGSTPTGAYHIVVTGTSNAMTQTTAITMIVR